MSSAGIRSSQRHLREIDTRIYGHFLVPIVMATVKWSIKSFEFKMEGDKTYGVQFS
jgi:hypothetical protein